MISIQYRGTLAAALFYCDPFFAANDPQHYEIGKLWSMARNVEFLAV